MNPPDRFTVAGILTSAAIVICGAVANADEGSTGGRFRRVVAGPLQILRRPDVRTELELTDAQTEEIQKLARTQSDEFRQRFARLRDMSADERRQAFARLRETRQKQCQATREQLRGTLTAGQYARFTELEFRYFLQRGAMVRALTTAGIKLSDAEMDRLTAVRQEVEAGVRKKIAAIQQQAQMEILGSVMSGEKIQRLLGDDFVFQRSPYPR